MRFAAASGHRCEHWRDVCVCWAGCGGTRTVYHRHRRDGLAVPFSEQRRADGKTNVGWVVFLIIAYLLSISYLVFFVLMMISAFTGKSVTVG